jgi:hypothetical protein
MSYRTISYLYVYYSNWYRNAPLDQPELLTWLKGEALKYHNQLVKMDRDTACYNPRSMYGNYQSIKTKLSI